MSPWVPRGWLWGRQKKLRLEQLPRWADPLLPQREQEQRAGTATPVRAFPTPPVPAGRSSLAERRTWGTLASQQKTAVGLELRDSSLANGTIVSFPDGRMEDRGGTKCTGLS